MEQRVNFKFFKLGKTATEAYAVLKEVHGHWSLSRIQVFDCFKNFKDGRETTKDDACPRRLFKNRRKNAKNWSVDPRKSSFEYPAFVELTEIDKENVHHILHETFTINRSRILHQDNEPVHSASYVKAFFCKVQLFRVGLSTVLI